MSLALKSAARREVKDICRDQERTPCRRDGELELEGDAEEDRTLKATVGRDTPPRQAICLDQ